MTKTKSIRIRVTEKELEKLKKLAGLLGKTVSAFLLAPVFDPDIVVFSQKNTGGKMKVKK